MACRFDFGRRYSLLKSVNQPATQSMSHPHFSQISGRWVGPADFCSWARRVFFFVEITAALLCLCG